MRVKSIHCLPAAAAVTLTAHSLEVSGIGYSGRFWQHEVSCSDEPECPHAVGPTCPARVYQAQLDNS